MNIVRDEDGTWLVLGDDGGVLRSGFASEDAAWAWADKYDDEAA